MANGYRLGWDDERDIPVLPAERNPTALAACQAAQWPLFSAASTTGAAR